MIVTENVLIKKVTDKCSTVGYNLENYAFKSFTSPLFPLTGEVIPPPLESELAL